MMCDASEHAAEYVLLIEEYTNSDVEPMKSYALVVFGSQIYTEGQMLFTIYANEFLSMHFAFDEFAHILVGLKRERKTRCNDSQYSVLPNSEMFTDRNLPWPCAIQRAGSRIWQSSKLTEERR